MGGEIAVENAMSQWPLLFSSPFGDIKVDDKENCPSSLLEDGSRYGLGEIPSDKQYEGAVWSFVLLIEKHTRSGECFE